MELLSASTLDPADSDGPGHRPDGDDRRTLLDVLQPHSPSPSGLQPDLEGHGRVRRDPRRPLAPRRQVRPDRIGSECSTFFDCWN